MNIKPLSFVYLSQFVNVKAKFQKEVNHERLTSFKNLAGISPSPFEAQYCPGLPVQSRFFWRLMSTDSNANYLVDQIYVKIVFSIRGLLALVSWITRFLKLRGIN